MIDKYKIGKAARQISEYVVDAKGFDDSKPTHLAFLDGHVDGFNAGAKWAINEFIKDLWHPANEVPEIGRVIIMENYYPDGRIMFISRMRKSTFHNPIDIGNTKKWFYIEDLFSKEGGKHD